MDKTKVKIGNEELELTEEQLNYLKNQVDDKVELKETVGWEQVAVYVGNLVLGYLTVEASKRIFRELKK